MSLYTDINYLFFSKENEKMLHSEKMEKLHQLINKSEKEIFQYGIRTGILEAKKEVEKLFDSKKRTT